MPCEQTQVPPSVRWLTLVDYAHSCLLITPLVVAYWRATCMLLDKLVQGQNPIISSGVCAGLGWIVCALGYLFQGVLRKLIFTKPKRYCCKSWQWLLLDHLYIYIFGLAVIAQWRGLWTLWDHLTGRDVTSGLTSLLVGWAFLIMLRSLINAVTTPLSISTDVTPAIFDCSTRFRAMPNKPRGSTLENFCLDALFTPAVVYGLAASLWRGIWTLEDLIFSPEQIKLSVISSVVLGYGLVMLVLLFQYSAQSSSEAMGQQFPFVLRVALQDTLVSLGILGVVNVWRGLWTLCDMWQSDHPPVWVLVLTHLLCIGVLMLLLSASTVHFRGCMLDGESAIFPVFYIRFLLKTKYFQETDETSRNKEGPTGKSYPSCSCNHYCLLLNVIRERNAITTSETPELVVVGSGDKA